MLTQTHRSWPASVLRIRGRRRRALLSSASLLILAIRLHSVSQLLSHSPLITPNPTAIATGNIFLKLPMISIFSLYFGVLLLARSRSTSISISWSSCDRSCLGRTTTLQRGGIAVRPPCRVNHDASSNDVQALSISRVNWFDGTTTSHYTARPRHAIED